MLIKKTICLLSLARQGPWEDRNSLESRFMSDQLPISKLYDLLWSDFSIRVLPAKTAFQVLILGDFGGHSGIAALESKFLQVSSFK